MLRRMRPLQLGAGAAMLAIPATAVALTAGQADAQSAIQITLKSGHVTVGHKVAVSGNASSAAAGAPVQLQFAPVASNSWRTLKTTRAGSAGGFRFMAPLRHSGLLRVVLGAPTSSSTGSGPAPRVAPAVSTAAVAPSVPRPITVAARFAVPSSPLSVTGGSRAHVRGKLLPASAGRRVRLLEHSSHGWRTVASTRTGGHGGFDLPVSAATGAGERWLRVAFSGDRRNGATWARAGSVTGLRPSVASWYDDAGATACGFHAFYGVANKSLPCGTRVRFSYGGRSVTAVVDDRGP
jgi:hypothetical protein